MGLLLRYCIHDTATPFAIAQRSSIAHLHNVIPIPKCVGRLISNSVIITLGRFAWLRTDSSEKKNLCYRKNIKFYWIWASSKRNGKKEFKSQIQTNERNENKRMEMQIEVDLICVFCSFDFDGQNPPRQFQHGKSTQTQWKSGLIQFICAITVPAILRQMILCVVGK